MDERMMPEEMLYEDFLEILQNIAKGKKVSQQQASVASGCMSLVFMDIHERRAFQFETNEDIIYDESEKKDL